MGILHFRLASDSPSFVNGFWQITIWQSNLLKNTMARIAPAGFTAATYRQEAKVVMVHFRVRSLVG
jgi:hypothetical protein